jgi:TolB-like protein
MIMPRFFKRVLQGMAALVLTLGLAACASNTSEQRDFVAKDAVFSQMTVAIIPFENLTNYPNAGRIVAELLATELYDRGPFTLQEATETRRALAQLQIDADNLTSVAAAKQAAGLLEVDGLLIGSVSEFGYQQGLREEPVVGLNARLIDGKTGDVLWASSHSALGGGYLQRGSLNATAQEVISAMTATLSQR